MPAQVVEKWINAVLKDSDDEGEGQVGSMTDDAIRQVKASETAKGLSTIEKIKKS